MMEIGLYSLGCVALGTLEIGAKIAAFHYSSTTPSVSDLLKRKASDATKIGAPNRRNHAGILPGLVAVGRSV